MNCLLNIILLSTVLCLSLAKQRRQIDFPDDESCQTPNRRPGVCISLNDCPQLRTTRNYRFLRRSVCGYDINSPLVCCPRQNPTPPPRNTRTPQPTRPSPTRPFSIVPTREPTTPISPIAPTRQKPSFLPKECGFSNFTVRRIVGGRKAELGRWPWLAAVYLTRSGLSRGTDCGGALVTNRHVITAAHCVTDRRGNAMSASSFTVRLGEHILNNDNDGATPIDFRVQSVVRHENFERRTFKNDIAVLTLQGRVEFNKFIHPACIPYDAFQGDDLEGRNAFAMGWGTTEFDGNFNPELTDIQIKIWNNEDCRKAFQKEVPITKEYLCAGVSDGTKDTCQGDSGGPLVLPNVDKRYYLIGVVSFGKRCATEGYPGVYTRLPLYLDWLTKHLS